MSRSGIASAECLNCRTPLTGPYCSRCGQKAAPLNPTFHDLLGDLAQELLSLDGKIFRSAWFLITRPGFLTKEYFAGRKSNYLSPLRLYLIFSVAFFGLSSFADREPIFEPDEDVEAGALGRMLGVGDMSPAEANRRATRAMTEWVPRAMFVLVPVYAGTSCAFHKEGAEELSPASVVRAACPRRVLCYLDACADGAAVARRDIERHCVCFRNCLHDWILGGGVSCSIRWGLAAVSWSSGARQSRVRGGCHHCHCWSCRCCSVSLRWPGALFRSKVTDPHRCGQMKPGARFQRGRP